MTTREWQFDGLVGPTHNYAGLAMGNLAAAKNKGAISNPRAAALQGLKKMRFVRDLGMPQAFLPPHYRPALRQLKILGFNGSTASILEAASKQAPGLLASVFSSSFMWAANAATVSPFADTADGKLHLTAANLVSHYHRAIEAEFSAHSLKRIFHNENLFSIHNAITPTAVLGDEGAANHMRICLNHGDSATNIFVYGKSSEMTFETKKYPARQEEAASRAVARLHGLNDGECFYWQQSPQAIDNGVFHNDVIAMNTTSLMVIHEDALIPNHQNEMRNYFSDREEYSLYEISAQDLSIADSVSTYLFNSQLLEIAPKKIALVLPSECENHAGIGRIVGRLKSDGVLDQAHYLDVHESMKNGGGPACLRLRIVLNSEQSKAIHKGVVLTDEKYAALEQWITSYYRDRLQFDDFRDPQLLSELSAAYLKLEDILDMRNLYQGFMD